jgi:ankyrin repeat protein
MSTDKVKSLTQVPIDILKCVFEWISDASVDACLLKQTNQSLKWILTNQVGWKSVLNPNLPFTQQLDVIARHFPTPTSPSQLEQLKVTCLTNGQLKNFEYLHGTDEEMAVVYLTAPIANGHLACLKALVKRCSAEFLANAHHLLMSATAIHGVIPIAEFLYSDCHIDIRAGGEAALIRACQHNQLEMVQWLVNRGADFRVNEDEPVFIATAGGHLELVKFFHTLGANVCAAGSFVDACANGHLDMVNYLIAAGVDIRALNERAMTSAIYRNQLEIVKRLQAAGYNLKNHFFFRTACQHGSFEIVEYMCSIKGNTHIQTVEPLELASYNGHLKVVSYLYSLGAGAHAKDERPIRLACQAGHIGIVEFLLSKGSDVHYDDDKLLRVACTNGQLDMVKFLCSIQTNIRGHEVPAVDSLAVRDTLKLSSISIRLARFSMDPDRTTTSVSVAVKATWILSSSYTLWVRMCCLMTMSRSALHVASQTMM